MKDGNYHLIKYVTSNRKGHRNLIRLNSITFELTHFMQSLRQNITSKISKKGLLSEEI